MKNNHFTHTHVDTHTDTYTKAGSGSPGLWSPNHAFGRVGSSYGFN